jgi:phosphonate transport system ATP-binding protein
MPAPDHPQLAVRDLEVERDGRRLIGGLSLSVSAGRFVVVAGPSGAGKTSLLACLGGMLKPAGGTVFLGSGGAPDASRHRLGLIFQHLLLTPNATAETNVLCGLLGQRPWWRTLLGFSAADRVRARELLGRLELSASVHTPVRRLSGGERQRVAIARALMASPDVLLADEPVSHLDPRLARQVLGLLRADARAAGRAVVCVLHDDGFTGEFADAVLRLRKDAPEDWSLETP